MPLSSRILVPVAACILLSTHLVKAEESEPITARLDWKRGSRAENCIDARALRVAVVRRFRREVFGTDASIVVSGTIERAEDGSWTAVIELRSADGESLGTRTLTTSAPDCSSLDDSVSLAIGLMIDLSRRRLIDERTGAAPANEAETPIAIPRETLAPRKPWRVEPSAGIEAGLGLLPSVALAGRLGVALEPPNFFRIEVAADVWFPEEDRNGFGRGGRWKLFTAELDVCPLNHRRARLSIHGCVAQRFGEISAVGVGFDQSVNAAEPLYTIGARVAGTYSLVGPLAVRLGIGGDIPLVRYRFVYADSSGATQTVRKMAPVAASAEAGLSLAW